MKPIIIHIIDDNRVGGVTGILENFKELNSDCLYHVRVIDLKTDKFFAPRIKADVAIVHYTLSWKKLLFFFSLRLKFAGKKLIINEHSYTEAYEKIFVKNKLRFHILLRFVYGLADQVVAVSKGQMKWIEENNLCAIKKLSYIQQYKNWPALEKIPLPKYDSSEPLKLLAFGRFHQQKGFDIAIEAMKQVSPRVAHLTLAGFGEDEEAYKRQARGYSHIHFSGAFQSPEKILRGHHAVLIPSRWEAFGQVAVEARAAGRPVIASNLDGLTEQIEKIGFLVTPENPEALAEKIVELQKRGNIEELGRRSRQSIKGGYQRWMDAWRLILETILKQ